MPLNPTSKIETFENPNKDRDYIIRFETQEFTCLCPLTGQPDFAHLFINYIPDNLNVELKSLKTFLWSFRDKGAFHEAITNQLLDALLAATEPRAIRLKAKWFVRGGIYTNIEIEHTKKNWSPLDLGILDKL
jgi:7-cyano-7-deazaguanine reductase